MSIDSSDNEKQETISVEADTFGLKEGISDSSPVGVATRLINNDIADVFNKTTNAFESKFNNCISTVISQKIGPIRKLDISPEKGLEKAVIFLAPGWLENIQTNKHLIMALVEFGYRVISLDHPRKPIGKLSPENAHTEAISTVIEDSDIKGQKIYGLASSLGAIDIARYADPVSNPDNDIKFADFILLNPAGLTGKDSMGKMGDLAHLLNKYLFGHSKQSGKAKKDMKDPENSNLLIYNGIPLTEIADKIRKEVVVHGTADLNANKLLALREAINIGSLRVQDQFSHLRGNGHKITVLTCEEDKLMPAGEYDLKVAGESGLGPNGKNIQYGSSEAQVDEVIQLAGYHNTFRSTNRMDAQNEQWMALVWINYVIEHSLSARESHK